MSTRTKTEQHIERGGARDIRHQPNRFLGLFLAPFAGLLTAWLIHVWTRGVDIHWGALNWTVHASGAAPSVATALITLATVGVAWVAWHFTEHRETVKRAALTTSVAGLGTLFAISVGTGPHYWWSGLFLISGWLVALTWSIARLDVARNDKRGDGEEQEDGLMKKLGISRRTRFKSTVTHDDLGDPVRIDMDVQHAPGETVKVLQDGIDAMESVAGGPPGMSTAVEDPDRADRSHLSVLLTNPFKRNILVGPLTAPGGSIADWSSVADYADGRPAFVTTAAGKHMPSSTSYGLIGMTRAGKTGTETALLTEWGSRYDWTCLYLNQAKGLQDIRPLLPIIEAAVIAEDGDAGLGDYVLAFKQLRAIMIYRQQRLAEYAVSAWSPRCADPDPDKRPTRLGAGGQRLVMEPMPFLTCHVGEADAILNSGKAASDAVYITSKGLSLGVNTGWSLQRPDWKSMPTELRANIGLWFAHGMSSTDEEEFVLDERTRAAGASPGRWGQRKPGQHYMTGPGIDESRFPVALKTRFLVGSDVDFHGRPISFDELNDRFMAEMLRRNRASAPGMMKLDQGSAEATDGWWEEQVSKTEELRSRMFSADPAIPHPATAGPAARKADPRAAVPGPQPAGDDEETPDPQEAQEAMDEFDEEAATTTEVEGINVYGDTPQEVAETRSVDLTVPFHPPATDYDPLADSAEDDKPAAATPDEARAELRRTLVALVDDPKFADRKHPGTALVTPGAVFDHCRLRSRPWISEQLTRIMMTGGDLEDGVVMEREGDPKKGGYRIRRTDGSGHGQ